jgi:heat shock protein HtpX
MPLTFIDIERQKNWRIWVFFLILMLMYFVLCLALAAPFLPHTLLFSTTFSAGRLLAAGFLIAFLVAGIHLFFAGYDAVSSVIRNLDARQPDPDDSVHKTLLNIMQEIHVVTGNKRSIRCVVIPSLSLNALAAADLKGESVIGITEGLLSRLSRPQLETVIAHEAHHILSGDCLETTVAASLFSSLSPLVDRYAPTPRGGHSLPPALWPAWSLLKLSYLLNMFISREREYRADAAAVRMTRNPVALAETLHLLSRSWRGAGFIGSGFEMMCIVNPQATALDESEGLWADLLSTHPPLKKRIDALLAMAHVSVVELDARAGNRPTSGPLSVSGPRYYAMSPGQQWQGPFTLGELGALPWLSPLTWISMGDKQATDRAWKNPLINAIFVARLATDRVISDLACPHCRQPLVMESYEGTQIHQCRFCAGTLVESDKISRILARTVRESSCTERVESLARAVERENQVKTERQRLFTPGAKRVIPLLSCPKCNNPMYRGFYSAAFSIEIDRCSFCGLTWFDCDELAMLQCLIGHRIVSDGAASGAMMSN